MLGGSIKRADEKYRALILHDSLNEGGKEHVYLQGVPPAPKTSRNLGARGERSVKSKAVIPELSVCRARWRCQGKPFSKTLSRSNAKLPPRCLKKEATERSTGRGQPEPVADLTLDLCAKVGRAWLASTGSVTSMEHCRVAEEKG